MEQVTRTVTARMATLRDPKTGLALAETAAAGSNRPESISQGLLSRDTFFMVYNYLAFPLSPQSKDEET
jgi:hypothetical protein